MSGHFDDDEVPPQQQQACAVRGLVAPGAMCSKVLVGGGCGQAFGTCKHQSAPAPVPAPARIQIGPLDV